MNVRCDVLPLAAQPELPWANGGGVTRQVAIDPPGATLASGFRWRVSIAQVAMAGPFSHLPGIDRSLWLLAGDGVVLDVAGRCVELVQPLQRFDFAGETPISCTLRGGPCEDLNVMHAREHVVATADVHELGAVGATTVAAPQHLVVVLQGRATVAGARPLLVREALRVEADAPCALRVEGDGAVVLLASFAPRR